MNTETNRSTTAQERLKDAISLIILLENDMTSLQADEMYTRVLQMVHRLIRSAMEELEGELDSGQSLSVQSAQKGLQQL